ncbi:hypothetical protein GA0070622_2825 [Micromonospora sediminicola]|uniref:Uncharacterized protein n=1 Tax=Micromonospora sediminicola TaxID=946078 RepID=A0A1A9BA86_9ACTN|nr:hypothetical protein [Micromonospora sediminicola]SBT65812.1 hypothetical protein GA0070622_2825 [Micromonospora sediminicola]
MVHVPSLPETDRVVLAEVLGVAGRYGTGRDRDASRREALSQVRAVCVDPWLLGVAAGTVAVGIPSGCAEPTVELLRNAGADMGVAADHEAEVRARSGESTYDMT